ncbi:MAG: hypothetical protein ABSA12_02995 [Verrucomicrobiia bacterium]
MENREIMTDATALNLLERISSVRTTMGDGLNDEELTLLMRQDALPSEAGFTFVALCDGWATFRVPTQDPANWYPESGRIALKKEALAKAIAQKCGYSLEEPPDERLLGSLVHHHLEMSRQGQVVVIAHPRYLKVRLFDTWTKRRLSLPPDIMEQLATLYRM